MVKATAANRKEKKPPEPFIATKLEMGVLVAAIANTKLPNPLPVR